MKKLVKKAFNAVGLELRFKKRAGDPNKIVLSKVGDFKLYMNYAHVHNSSLLFENYSKNLPRIIQLVHEKYPAGSVTDVGANIGDTAALIKTAVDVSITCIEGDQFYFNLLKKNAAQFKNVHLLNFFIGENDQATRGVLVQDHGTLSILADPAAHEIAIHKLDTLAEKMPEQFQSMKVLKVDTDGYDLKVLRGAKNCLATFHPVVFFEYSEKHLKDAGEDGLSIFPFFKDLGYSFLVFYDAHGRFILSNTLENAGLTRQIHNYIANFNYPLQYVDIAVFHEDDRDIFEKCIDLENRINKDSANKQVDNKA